MPRVALLPVALALAMTPATMPALAGEVDPHCAEYGAGFIYSPDSGFCVRLGGEVQVGVSSGGRLHTPSHYTSSHTGAFGPSVDARSGLDEPDHDPFGTSATLSLDARKQTDYGPLRLYVQPRANVR